MLSEKNDPMEGMWKGPSLFAVFRASGLRRELVWHRWCFPADSPKRAWVTLRFAGMVDMPVEWNLATGEGGRYAKDWHLDPESQELLIAWAAEHGRIIEHAPPTTAVPLVRRKRKPKVEPKQLGLFDGPPGGRRPADELEPVRPKVVGGPIVPRRREPS